MRKSATKPAAQVWRWLFDEPWPKGWRVQWVGFMRGAKGLTIYSERRVLLGWGDFGKKGNPLPTVIHEFLHMRGFKRHTKEFKEHETRLLRAIEGA